jgi:hypothetical protein
MRIILAIQTIFVFVLSNSANGQDLIILQTKDSLQAKIVEVTDQHFRYEIKNNEGKSVKISLSRNDVSYYI